MISPEVKRTLNQLQKASLSLEDRTALLTAILEKLSALPLSDSIVIGQGSITINNKQLDAEQMILFRESCLALQDSWARKVLRDQVKYLATNLGIYKSVSLDELFFFKAALWCLSEEDKLINQIV